MRALMKLRYHVYKIKLFLFERELYIVSKELLTTDDWALVPGSSRKWCFGPTL